MGGTVREGLLQELALSGKILEQCPQEELLEQGPRPQRFSRPGALSPALSLEDTQRDQWQGQAVIWKPLEPGGSKKGPSWVPSSSWQQESWAGDMPGVRLADRQRDRQEVASKVDRY